ncbi:hypothetical protein E2562_025892 [Oryza meyeriana var. granulata]|uniref:Uncharacterized protein n=1 Tax=Oryza meyeriana var. granulata TaxID=110450 RepID=A0A6G1CIG9_9ORYZ|nr:hypothetical protein E2562_025892 [Oryza meyeriana var. granulata]
MHDGAGEEAWIPATENGGGEKGRGDIHGGRGPRKHHRSMRSGKHGGDGFHRSRGRWMGAAMTNGFGFISKPKRNI